MQTLRSKLLLGFSVFIAFFVSGCASHTVISRTYNFNNMHRIGILRVDSNNAPVEGVEDLLAQYLIKNGFTVIERAQLEQVMKENNIEMAGMINPTMTKQLGQLLGVDCLMIAEVSSYTPEKETTTIAKTEDTYVEPNYGVERRMVNGMAVDSIVQTGSTIRREENITPITFTTSPKIGLIVKLVDVETAEIVWVGSVTEDGDNVMEASENDAAYLMNNLRKDIASVVKKKNK